MKTLSKILVMAVVILAVVTMSVRVNAAEANNILMQYIRDAHNVNGMLFELTNSQKNAICDYVATLSEEQASAIHADLVAMEQTIKNTGATSTSKISNEVRTSVLNQAKATAAKAGLTLNVNTKDKSFTLTKSNGETLASGSYKTLATNPGTASGKATTTSTAKGSKLLYTGANYAVYALPVLAIVAVAVVVKKRSK